MQTTQSNEANGEGHDKDSGSERLGMPGEPERRADVDRNQDLNSSRRITSRFGKAAIAVVVAFFVFSLGVGVGDGRIALGVDTNPSKQLPQRLDYSSVNQVYDKLRSSYDGTLDQQKLLDGLKAGLTKATGDPYTDYFTPDEAKQFEGQLNNEFSGIGAELGQDKDNNLVVVAPIAGTPAAKAGLKPQDIIAEINKQNTTGMSVEEAVNKIRGPKDSTVDLTIVRGHSQTLDLKITRDDIKVPSVDSKTLDGNIGYLHITTFADDTGQLAQQEAQKLHDDGVKAMILDLRGNPGGRVDAAVSVASLWLPQGKMIMQEKRGNAVQATHTAQGGDIFNGLPTIVLLDDGSASASEIVGGALHDNGAAKIYGVKSYGKGSVQQILQLNDGGELKVTVARWYRPNGQNIDKKGITPDQVVKQSDSDTSAGKDTQLEAAEAALRQ